MAVSDPIAAFVDEPVFVGDIPSQNILMVTNDQGIPNELEDVAVHYPLYGNPQILFQNVSKVAGGIMIADTGCQRQVAGKRWHMVQQKNIHSIWRCMSFQFWPAWRYSCNGKICLSCGAWRCSGAMITEVLLHKPLRTRWFWMLLDNLKANLPWTREMIYFLSLLHQPRMFQLSLLLLNWRLCQKLCQLLLWNHHRRQGPGDRSSWLINRQAQLDPSLPRRTLFFQCQINNHRFCQQTLQQAGFLTLMGAQRASLRRPWPSQLQILNIVIQISFNIELLGLITTTNGRSWRIVSNGVKPLLQMSQFKVCHWNPWLPLSHLIKLLGEGHKFNQLRRPIAVWRGVQNSLNCLHDLNEILPQPMLPNMLLQNKLYHQCQPRRQMPWQPTAANVAAQINNMICFLHSAPAVVHTPSSPILAKWRIIWFDEVEERQAFEQLQDEMTYRTRLKHWSSLPRADLQEVLLPAPDAMDVAYESEASLLDIGQCFRHLPEDAKDDAASV